MMEAAHTSETSVDIQLRTRQYIPENSELQKKFCSLRSRRMFRLIFLLQNAWCELIVELKTSSSLWYYSPYLGLVLLCVEVF
jgi:hypothetical protein